MTNTQIPILNQDQLTLKGLANTYDFEVKTGTVVGNVTVHPTEISFFLKTEDGKEHDITLKTSMKAREGHIVSVIYASKAKAKMQYPVGWVNHTTTKSDIMSDSAMKVVGAKLLTFFSIMAQSSAAAAENTMDRSGGCAFIFIAPILFLFFAFAVGLIALAALFGAGSYKQATAVKKHTQLIASQLNPAIPAVIKTSLSKRIAIWTGVILILFLVFMFIQNGMSIENKTVNIEDFSPTSFENL